MLIEEEKSKPNKIACTRPQEIRIADLGNKSRSTKTH